MYKILSKNIISSYAKAAFEFSYENNCISQWQKMLELISEITKNKNIEELILSNFKYNLLVFKYLKKICEKYIDKYFENFLQIISENNRLIYLHKILKYFKKLKYEHKKIKKIEFISAKKINKIYIKQIILILENKYSCKLIPNYKIDKSLISGIIINCNGIILDGSVKNRIKNLKKFL